MSYKLAFLLGLVCLATYVVAEVTEEEDVAVLTDNNFDDWIKDKKFALLELYAPWCGHCKKLAPEYSKAAKKLKENDPVIPLAKVDATEQKTLATKFSVQGFPTLKFYAEGSWIDYTGGRTEKEIIAWLQKRTGQVTTEIKTVEELNTFVDSNQVALVYFGSSESDDLYKTFKQVAMGIEGLVFGHVFGHDAVRESKQAKANSVVLFKKFDEGRNDYTGSATSADELKKFVDTYSFGIVMKFDDRAIEKVFQQGNPTIFLFSNDQESSQSAEKAFSEVAHLKRGGKVLFSSSKPNDGSGHFQKLADYVGVDTQRLPAIMLVHASREINKYKFDKEITADNIAKFVDDYNANKLEVYYKSEDIPAEQKEAVQVVVGKSFKSVVLDNNKDVLVEFYAPWCGHCKQLAPKYEAAAQKLKANPNIVIAKVDATANEVPGVNIRSFPTLKFWPGNKKGSPVDFDGAREEDGIIQWIKDHTTHPWVELGGETGTGSGKKEDGKGHDDL